MKKIMAFACALVMLVSMFVVTTNAATEGCTATLEFAGYETKGTAENPVTFAKIVVKATIPDTLVPFKQNKADWVNTFEDTYEGKLLQLVGFDIPNVEGLAYTDSLSTKASYITVAQNEKDNKITLVYNGGENVSAYYSGEINELATLYYRITGDVKGTYNVALTDAVIGLTNVNEKTGAVKDPYEYKFADFTITNATVKPAEPVIEYEEVVDAVDADVTTLSDGTYTWENIAIYKATFDLDNIVAEKGYGIKAGDYSYGAAVKGTGTVDYVLAFYGIADTDDLAVSEYYTVVKK